MPEIRGVKQSDLSRLAKLERLCFSCPWSEDGFRSFLASGGVVLTAAEENEVFAFISASFAADEGNVCNLAVAPDRRRQGWGKRLLSALEKEAEKRGASVLYLEVRVSNFAARALYESSGFSPVGKRPKFYSRPTEDAELYRKELIS